MEPGIDLDNCAREPIHIPGAIQPHGLLFALQEPTLDILQVSRNIESLLGRRAEDVVGTPFGQYVVDEDLQVLQSALRNADLKALNPLRFRLHNVHGFTIYDAIVHRSDRVLILELEPSKQEEAATSITGFYHRVREATLNLQTAQTFTEVCEMTVKRVRSITGFDRVTIYQFDPDWNGIVVAEDRSEAVDSYMGLRFPASDIPAQARQLYRLNWLRLIADVNYQPAPLVPSLNPLTGAPLDLSFSTLRSVSPVHLEYMRNLKMGASMSISIIRDGELWGLISCHHSEARYVDYQTRVVCEFIGQILSQHIVAIEGRNEYHERQRLQALRQKVLSRVEEHGFPEGILHGAPTFMDLVDAQGGVLLLRNQRHVLGVVPAEAELRDLLKWLQKTMQGSFFATDRLAALYPPAAAFKDQVAGLMAVSISRSHESLLVWFRPEIIQTVAWAGNPEKPVQAVGPGDWRLHPRQSFELWKETVRLTAKAWTSCETGAARQFRDGILAEELARLNQELEHSNSELDAFAHVASHDLKEPLRGIKNYANFVLEDAGPGIDAKSRERLATIPQLCDRMDELLASLYQYSRVGRIAMAMDHVDLSQVVDEVLLRLRPFIEEKGAEVQKRGALPRVRCDRVRIGEVFYNLISNAIKYNDNDRKRVQVGYTDGTLFVSDNGIGIPEKQQNSIFAMFKRLHDKQAYGGGTGSGLAIVKRIVQMHHGRVWVESYPGEGSTFYFTLNQN